MQALELAARLQAKLRIEIRERLVHQIHGRIANDGASERHALLLTAGELRGTPAEKRIERDAPGRRAHAPIDLVGWHFPGTQRKRDVVVHTEVRIQRVVLKHDRDVTRGWFDIVDDPIANPDPAFVRPLESGEQAEQRCLSASRWTEQDKALARSNLEIDVFQCRVRAEPFGDALESHSHSALLYSEPMTRANAAARTLRPLLLTIAVASLSTRTDAASYEHRFNAAQPAEILATVTVRCERCAWDVVGREAVMLTVTLDGRYVQHLPVVRAGRAEYKLLIGYANAGAHTLSIDEDAKLTAHELRDGHAVVESVAIQQLTLTSTDYEAVSLAPILHARPDTIGRFTDAPVLMWYEIEPTRRGRRYRYSVIFTNEDGGTPADRLMATWGRTTDIEYVYSVEIDRRGNVLDEDMQGPEHEVLPFRGKREGRHPLLWVSTDNNMVLDAGTTAIRHAPAPVSFPLRDVSREEVMDVHSWLYALAAQELMREGKILSDAPPGGGQISDPRRFVYLEGCGELERGALAFAIRLKDEWIASDRGIGEYRIMRDGCFRAAIPLPASAGASDVRALRAQAYTRPPKGKAPPEPAGTVRLTRINRVFMLDETFKPQPPLMTWRGITTLTPDGPPQLIVSR
jgi:hypothetical protein